LVFEYPLERRTDSIVLYPDHHFTRVEASHQCAAVRIFCHYGSSTESFDHSIAHKKWPL